MTNTSKIKIYLPLLAFFRKEFRKDYPFLHIDLIEEFREGWEKISGNLDLSWQNLSPEFVMFVFRESEI
jgi:hypothetical protein